jgi:hypothetical protein
MSQFDPASFLFATTSETTDTISVPVPVGEYQAIVEKVACRPWQAKDGSSSGLALDIIYNVDDATVKALLGRDKVVVKQGIMLELTDAGALDNGKGKNPVLGRLREAVGQNVKGQPWAPSMLEGQPLKVSVKHRIANIGGVDTPVAEVNGTLKLA